METRRQDRDILSHQFRGQQGGGTSTHVEKEIAREKEEIIMDIRIEKKKWQVIRTPAYPYHLRKV